MTLECLTDNFEFISNGFLYSIGFTTLCSGGLTLHLQTKCGREPHYMCLVCSKKFPSARILRSHREIHTVFECNDCVGASFSTYSELYRHHSKLHASHKFECSVCNRKYFHENVFRRHMATHFAVKAWKCHGCSEGFDNIGALRKHRAQSTTCKWTPYSSADTTGITPTNDVSRKWPRCSICKQRFRTEKRLEAHKTIHGKS